MSSAHILYIPMVLFLGVVIGFVLGRQAAGREAAEAARRLERRQDRLAALRAELSERPESPKERVERE